MFNEFCVFFTHEAVGGEQGYSVRTLTSEEVREMYDNGVDIFFNFEMYV